MFLKLAMMQPLIPSIGNLLNGSIPHSSVSCKQSQPSREYFSSRPSKCTKSFQKGETWRYPTIIQQKKLDICCFTVSVSTFLLENYVSTNSCWLSFPDSITMSCFQGLRSCPQNKWSLMNYRGGCHFACDLGVSLLMAAPILPNLGC